MSRFPPVKPQRSSRRRPRIHLPTIGIGDIDPGSVRFPQVPRRGLRLEDIVSGNFINGYLSATTGEYTVATSPGWTRPGAAGNDKDLRVRLGFTDTPLLCDFKGQIGVSNNSAVDFHARICAVLYTGDLTSGAVYQRSEAIASIWLPADNRTYTLPLITSFVVPESTSVTDASTGEAADWHFGFQLQNQSGSNRTGFQNNNQSITCTFYSVPLIGSDDNDQSGSTFDAPLPRTVFDNLLT